MLLTFKLLSLYFIVNDSSRDIFVIQISQNRVFKLFEMEEDNLLLWNIVGLYS